MSDKLKERTLYYGKDDVFVYRTFAKPLTGIKPIPESSFTGNDNVIFALNVKFTVYGQVFLTSFTEGDNTFVVATDSMKNFILRQAAEFEGDTIESFLAFVSERFLEKYPHVTSIAITGDRLPFVPVEVPSQTQGSFSESGLVYRRSHNDYSSATLEISRSENCSNVVINSLLSGLMDLQLIKVNGSSFYGFIRDEYTTLPETYDRPLYIFLNIYWEYTHISDSLLGDNGYYVPSEQVRDIAQTIFHENKTPSIQNLIYQIGLKVLSRFPQLSEVRFESNNRTWDTIVETISASEGKVFTEPRPPFGFQGFSVTREDLKE